MPDREQDSYLQQSKRHIEQAEAYKNQKDYDRAIAEYTEAIKLLKTIWLQKQALVNNTLMMFTIDSFDNQNITAIKLGIAECYIGKEDLDSAFKIFAQINPAYISNREDFNRKLSGLNENITLKAKQLVEKSQVLLNMLGQPVTKSLSTEKLSWDTIRGKVNSEAAALLSERTCFDNAGHAFDLTNIYMYNRKHLNAEERALHNRLIDRYEQYDSGRHPMAGPIPRL